MDKITKAVKAFYQAYPYPTGIPANEPVSDPLFMLQQAGGLSKSAASIGVMEAGCGCAEGLIAAARRNPDIQFTGVDINPAAIKQAQRQVTAAGLRNIRFAQTDLLNPGEITRPAGGFDIIYSYGVLHHLTNPSVGLDNLKKLLAPQGILICMVYGHYGREPLNRLREAINLMIDAELAVEQRVPPARLLAEVAEQSLFKETPWAQTAQLDEIGFVDRCLHIHEQSFDVDSLWDLLESVGLCFVRWVTPDDWSTELLLSPESVRPWVQRLSKKDQYKLIERLFYRPRLEFIASRL